MLTMNAPHPVGSRCVSHVLCCGLVGRQSLPASFSKLHDLEVLRLSNNRLTELHPEMHQHTRLWGACVSARVRACLCMSVFVCVCACMCGRLWSRVCLCDRPCDNTTHLALRRVVVVVVAVCMPG
jgi:hypothetical protein